MRRLILLVLTLIVAMPAVSGETVISLETPDGASFNVFNAGPEDAQQGILLVHDCFGVSPFYHEAVERQAAHALAPRKLSAAVKCTGAKVYLESDEYLVVSAVFKTVMGLLYRPG